MAIRGTRNPIPQKGDAPTGIFSTRGSQKLDPNNSPNKDVMTYAHGTSARKGEPRSAGAQGLRHQAPNNGKVK